MDYKYDPDVINRARSLGFKDVAEMASALGYNATPEQEKVAIIEKEKIKMKSTESAECYWTTKNKRTVTGRIELKKYDKKLRKHVTFREVK